MNFLAMFDFTEEDLRSNKRGFFTPGQREIIENMAGGIRKSSWGGLKVVPVFLILGLCLILGMFLSSESYRAMLFTDPAILISLAAIVPVVFCILALGVYLAYRRADRLSNSDLKNVEGRVRLDEVHSEGAGTAYYVIIGKIKFVFPEDISGTFREGQVYRIFYCETSMFRYMLSFEKVDSVTLLVG